MLAAAAGSAGCSFSARGKIASKGPDTKPPNFIVIFVDDQGYQDLGCYGSPKINRSVPRPARHC